MQVKHQELYNEFSATFPRTVVKKWTIAIENWEADPSVPNPYQEPADSKQISTVVESGL